MKRSASHFHANILKRWKALQMVQMTATIPSILEVKFSKLASFNFPIFIPIFKWQLHFLNSWLVLYSEIHFNSENCLFVYLFVLMLYVPVNS